MSSKTAYIGKYFCFTGPCRKATRPGMIKIVEDAGGKVTSTVTKDTTFLVTNDISTNSSKLRAARRFGTKIISEEEFFESAFIQNAIDSMIFM